MSQIIITEPYGRRADTEAITIERALMLRAMRRRRVAKRMYKRVPLFAVEEMQGEFPGYDWDGYVADITRKTRKGKSFRHIKTKAWDWKQIQSEIPDFFQKCVLRTKTKAAVRGRMLKDGVEFTLVFRSHWFGSYGESMLRTSELITLWKTGNIGKMIRHPSVISFTNNNSFMTHEQHREYLANL